MTPERAAELIAEDIVTVVNVDAVKAQIVDAIWSAVKEEREACAKYLEDGLPGYVTDYDWSHGDDDTLKEAAAAIRARSKKQ